MTVIAMSRNELTRLRVLIDVADRRLSVADATGLIGVEGAAASHPDRITSIDRDRRSGDEIGRLARQERGDTRQVPWDAPAALRRTILYTFVQSRHLLADIPCQVGVNPTRQHGVDLNVVLSPSDGHGAAHLNDSPLRAGIGGRESCTKQ